MTIAQTHTNHQINKEEFIDFCILTLGVSLWR